MYNSAFNSLVPTIIHLWLMKSLRASLSLLIYRLSLNISSQLGDRRLGVLQSLVWRRSADEDTALPEEGDLPEGGGGGTLPLSCHLSSPGPTLPHPGLPTWLEYWIMVTGGFVAAFENSGMAIMVHHFTTAPDWNILTTIWWVANQYFRGS